MPADFVQDIFVDKGEGFVDENEVCPLIGKLIDSVHGKPEFLARKMNMASDPLARMGKPDKLNNPVFPGYIHINVQCFGKIDQVIEQVLGG